MKKVFVTFLAVAFAMGMSAAVTPHYAIEAGYDHGLAHVRTPDLGYSYYFANAQMDGFHFGGNVQLDFLQGQHVPSLIFGVNYQFLTTNMANKNNDVKQRLDFFKEIAKNIGSTDVVTSDYAYMHNLQIPIRYQYTYQVNNDWRLYLQTGPQIRLHLSLSDNYKATGKLDGKKYGTEVTDNYLTGNTTTKLWNNGEMTEATTPINPLYPDFKYNVFDMTWGFGCGFAWKNLGFLFTYDFGMINLFNSDLAKDPRFGGEKWKYNSDALAVTLSYRIK